MSRNEQVNLDLTATDEASAKVETVADAVADLEDHGDAEIVLRARVDEAKGDLRKLQADLAELEATKATATVTVDTNRGELADVVADVKALDGLTATAHVDVDVGKAVKHLDDVDRKVRASGEKTVSAVRDMTGPLGEVSGAFGDFGDAGVAAAESIGSAIGLSETAVAGLGVALGAAGLVIAGLQIAWSKVRGAQQKAREEVAKYTTAIEKAHGDVEAAFKSKAIEDLSTKQIRGFLTLGLTLDDVANVVTGSVVPAWTNAKAIADKVSDAIKVNNVNTAEGAVKFAALSKETGLTRDQLVKYRTTVEASATAMGGESSALQQASRDYQDKARFTGGAETATRNYRAEIDRIPSEVATRVTINTTAASAALDALEAKIGRIARTSSGLLAISADAAERAAANVTTAQRAAARRGTTVTGISIGKS